MRKPRATGAGPDNTGLRSAVSLGGDAQVSAATGLATQCQFRLAMRIDRRDYLSQRGRGQQAVCLARLRRGEGGECWMCSAPRILDLRLPRKNALLTFANIRLPWGTVVSDVTIPVEANGQSTALPGKPLIGSDGMVLEDVASRVRFQRVIELGSSELRDRRSGQILETLR